MAPAFFLRDGENGLSVNWLEYLTCSNREEEIEKVRNILNTKLTLKPRARIAVLNVGKTRKKVLEESSDSRNLEVIHTPSSIDPSHNEICNINPEQELIAELILQSVYQVYPAIKEK